MNFKFPLMFLLTGCLALTVNAAETSTTLQAPDKEKISYAMGMNMGLQMKHSGADVDPDAIAQAFKDVLAGRPTKVKDSEVRELLDQTRQNGLAKQSHDQKEKVSYAVGMRLCVQVQRAGTEIDPDVMAEGIKDVLNDRPTKISEADIEPLFIQAKTYGLAKMSEKNKAESAAFFAKNAKEPGVKVLPDGLQYQVIKEGDGEIPNPDQLIAIKYRATFLDGTEFDHKEYYPTRPGGGLKFMQEALQRMKFGSKWKIFAPADLAYGHSGLPQRRIGPDAALIYELESLSGVKPNDPRLGGGRVGHGLDDAPQQVANATQTGQTNAVPDKVNKNQ